ncbi:helix-turn-helix domain-containing protein [Kribbella sindirgiensis]|uniref:XRE family transcriptional regulator n=1 Tax=Kribbella sindirgiensis TaxID=1124744 RepID=A0A4R0IM42_9ACTN|nr:helix-turn-helix transcriptional regulator [Kribbella sindirgiensis]TCC34651.1 XRE family transcriptional regulator [Kribbella sindirgiensis]
MARLPVPARTRLAGERIGAHLTAWRKLQGLTAAQVADRAGLSRDTLRKLEHGETTVGLDVFLNVARVLGTLDRLVEALDPYETDLGRARADQALPKRVRR